MFVLSSRWPRNHTIFQHTRLFEMESTVALEGERQQLINEVTALRGQAGQRQPAPSEGPASSTPTIDSKVIGKADHCNVDSARFSDRSFTLKSNMGALDSRDRELLAEAEQSADLILIATRDPTEASHSAQLCYVLVMLATATFTSS